MRLSLIFGLIPSIAMILSLALLIRYPITRKTHADQRAEPRAIEM
jgi:Na+/melibiose symporter-like transporter